MLVEARGAVRVWRLNRPRRRNALDHALLAALDAARARATAEGARAVVLTGADPAGAFCAGLDLQALRLEGGGRARADLPLVALFHEALACLEDAPFALVTAVNGPAVGGGCELALAGDVRLARPGAPFAIPAARLGVTYPTPGLVRLRDALGPSLLRAMLTTGAEVEAERLARAGVLWALSDDPLGAALEVAAALEALPPAAAASHRRALRNLAPEPRPQGRPGAEPAND